MLLEKLIVKNISEVISTDDILPARYKHISTDPSTYRSHVFENKFPGLYASIAPGTVIVSDKIFGIGSSREQAVTALLSLGVSAVIAPAFGRIFFRNSWNLALPVFEMKLRPLADDALIDIDFSRNELIANNTDKYPLPAIHPLMQEVMKAGGLLSYYKSNIQGYEAK